MAMATRNDVGHPRSVQQQGKLTEEVPDAEVYKAFFTSLRQLPNIGMAVGNDKHFPIIAITTAHHELTWLHRETLQGQRHILNKFKIVSHVLEQGNLSDKMLLQTLSLLG